MHLDAPTLDRLRRDDLTPDRAAAARAHLATCEPCRSRFDDARLFGLLEHVDDPPPDVDAATVIARAHRSRRSGALRWAAGLLLSLGAAGAVYAAPGSPIRSWIASRSTPESGAPSVGDPVEPGASGVAVAAGSGLVIEVTPPDAGRLVVRLVDEADVTVEATGAPTRFDSESAHLLVTPSGPALLRIAIPRDAPDVRLVVAGDTVMRVNRGRVTGGVQGDELGEWVIAFGEAGGGRP